MENEVKERDELIEMLGIHFEQFHNIPPLAARIFSTLVISCRERGLTFDEIVAKTAASKSSVSTNLNLLLKMDKITFYTITGDRKKYFKPNSLANRIKNHLKILESEKNIFKAVRDYEKQTQTNMLSHKEDQGIIIYREYLNNFEQLLKKSIIAIEKIENTN